MEFPWQEYWSGMPFPSLGDLLDPGIKPTSLALTGGFFTTEPPRKPLVKQGKQGKDWEFGANTCEQLYMINKQDPTV